MTTQTVLVRSIWSGNSLTRSLLLALGGSLLIALGAQISVPMYPVPMTLQTLAILVVGFSLGSRLGALAVLFYLAEGAAGLPVFANGGAGLAYMAGPTAGFLVGFVMMGFVAGHSIEKGLSRGFISATLVAIIASALIYLPGLAYPAVALGKTFPDLISGWMLPFVIGDIVKAVLAALIVTGGWAVLARRKG